jgi:hypothetical protein
MVAPHHRNVLTGDIIVASGKLYGSVASNDRLDVASSSC